MPALAIERIYRSKEEIEEYRRAEAKLGDWRFAGLCLWKLDLPRVLERWQATNRQLGAWSGLCGFLDDLTPGERERFDEAVKRRPLFDDEG